jgi:hypothetical protein
MDLTHFSENSKIWIYQTNRDLNKEQEAIIEQKLVQFIAHWNSHGAMLKAGFEILQNRFIIIAVDESNTQASGCSIDKSVTVIKEIEAMYNLGLLERGNVSYKDANGDVHTITFNQIKNTVSQGEIVADTLIFDNSIDRLGLLETDWLKKAEKTWLKKYFTKDLSL